MTQIHTCLNCSAEIRTGPFCEQCGQRNVHARLELLDLLGDIRAQLLEWHLPWLYTLKQGLLRPGTMCREYVDGKRVKYVNPLKYMFYLMSAALILLAVLPDRFGLNPLAFMNAFATNGDEAGNTVQNVLILAALLAPLIAIPFRLLYSTSKYNTTEISCFILYALGNGVLVAMLVNVLLELGAAWLVGLTVYDYDYVNFIGTKGTIMVGAVTLHTIYAATNYFDEAWYFSWLKVLSVFVLCGVAVGTIFDAYLKWTETRPASEEIALKQSVLLNEGVTWLDYDRYSLANLDSSPFREEPGISGRFTYGQFLLSAGRSRDGLYYLLQAQREEFTSAYRRDYVAYLLAMAYAQLGQADFAHTQIAALEASTPTPALRQQLHSLRLDLALQTHDLAGVTRLAEEPVRSGDLESKLAALWSTDDTSAMLNEIRLAAGSAEADEYVLAASARWAATLGDPAQAWHSIDAIADKNVIWRSVWMPHFRAVRALPKFKAFVREQGLEDYWRKTGNWADGCRPLGDDDFECF